MSTEKAVTITQAQGIEHRVEQGAMYCSCTLDVVTCQGCGQTVCGTLASWLDDETEQHLKGNHCRSCVQRLLEGETVIWNDESLTEDDFSHQLTHLLRTAWERHSTAALTTRFIESYSSAGMLTSDEGLVVTLKSGEVFHLTIKRAR
jgi:hypothetical protein